MPKGFSKPSSILEIASNHATAMQKAKAAAIASEALVGGSIKDLASKYGITKNKVEKYISLAEKSGFFERVEEQIMQHLIPPALAVYEAALEKGDVEAARDVLFGMGVFRKVPKDQMDGIESITAYRILRQSNDGSKLRQGPGADVLDASYEGPEDGRIRSDVPNAEAIGRDPGEDGSRGAEAAGR